MRKIFRQFGVLIRRTKMILYGRITMNIKKVISRDNKNIIIYNGDSLSQLSG